jgi:hypothetical protein
MPKILLSLLLFGFLSQFHISYAREPYDSNNELSEFMRKNLSVDVLTWTYGKHPVLSFWVADDGKISDINIEKRRNRLNASHCANSLITMDALETQYRSKRHRFECKPSVDLSKKEFKQVRKITREYFTYLNKKVKMNWFPEPRHNKLRALISFDLYHDGSISKIKFLDSSNDEDYDALVKRVIEMASPFAPLEDEIFTYSKDKEKLTVLYDFDSRPSYNDPFYDRAVGMRAGTYGAGLGLGLGYGRGPMRNMYWNRPYHPAYWW